MTRDWLAAVAWWRPAPLPARVTSDWEKYLTSMTPPVWADAPAPLSTTELPDPAPVPHLEHVLYKLDNGTIACTCGMSIPQPDGMPNYDGAAMGDW